MLRKGQRTYGGPPPNWTGPPPTKGSEVFVGKIPRDLMEDELLPIFETVGPVFEIRLMMDGAAGGNRGFAFVTFTSPTDAARAIQLLNHYEIRPKRFIGVLRSLDNCRLFIGGIPNDKSKEDIREEMSRHTDGVVAVILYSAIADKSKNRGFAFVEYESHRAAAVARRKCMTGRFQLFEKSVAVDWAEPEPTVEEDILSKVRVLYVRNLVVLTPEDVLADLFNAASNNGVEKVKVLKDYAFVHFASRSQAQQAMDSLQDLELNGAKMQITWAKPVTKKNRNCVGQSKLSVSSTTSIGTVSHHSHYPVTAAHVWPHVPFTHPAAMQPHLNGLHAFPPYPLYPNQSVSFNYVMPDRNHNQLPVDLFYSDSSPSDFIHQRTNDSQQQQGITPWMNGGYADNVKILTFLCRLHAFGDPLFETSVSADHRYAAKVIIPGLGPPYNVFQVAQTYATEMEAEQAIAGCVINHVNQVLSAYGERSLCSRMENVSLKGNGFPGHYIASV
ncbi:probable RNA-binding protein 46 isoform X2 [Daphnia carinata]|uniref:probable RNA-binding protein 46 isoform X2 n=1 Tax=Daphnia carinata TaxID=120202 RepID=UPI00257FE681|nr:probable RNA-binding protein 46 isoform X2 [Daphnia carinata]